MVDNPNARRITCPTCGLATKYNMKSGRLYSHQKNNSLEVCEASTTQAMRERPYLEKTPSPNIQKDLAPTAMPLTDTMPDIHSENSSVRAISGGLPGHGKKR